MDHFAGLDVSVKETSICIVDDAGKIVREVKVASEPEALLAVLKNPAYHTSSARASTVSGTVRPSALAVLRLMTSWYFVGAYAQALSQDHFFDRSML